DVTRPADVDAAMRDMDAVIHLAVASGHEGDYEDDAFNQLRFDVNVRGTANVLETARRAGVRRFVHTSSLMVVWGREPPQWVASDIGFEIVTVVGESSRRRWDLGKAERLLGYRPAVRLEELGYELGDEREPL